MQRSTVFSPASPPVRFGSRSTALPFIIMASLSWSAARIVPPESDLPDDLPSLGDADPREDVASAKATSSLATAAQVARFAAKGAHPSFSSEVEIKIEGTSPSVFRVRVDSRDQHTIDWSVDVRELDDSTEMEPLGASDGGGGARDLWYELLQERRGAWRKAASLARAQRTVDADGVAKIDLAAVHTAHRAEELTLPAGSCNLYAFPLVKTSREPRGSHPTAAGLRTLKKIVLALYSQTGCLDCEDQVGAQPVHALAVCNVPEAISLVVDLYRLRPQLMSRVHTSTRTGMPLFLGESVLHILAVNKREAELVQVVGLATRTLPLPDARALFGSVAAGVFFAQRPMLLFGGTALSYAVAFELAGAVHALLSTGLVSLNDRSQACPLSGFLPLHAAVACGSTSMYDLLTMELPYELRAREGLLTSKARHPEYHGLSCIQLAATLGDQDALQHLLKKQCEARWEWGPVIEYALDLDGIDSAGRGGNDIMELIARAGANRATTVC